MPARRSFGARALGVLTNLLLLVAFAFGAMLLIPTALGMHHYVILTGSMTGTYDRGSIIFDRPVPTDELSVGDAITYSPPPGQTAHSQVTHRIYRLTRGRDGNRVYQTKGDANIIPDPWKFRLPQPTQDKVIFHVPYAGFGLGVLSDPHYRRLLLGIPALLVIFGVLRGLWRDAGEEERRTPGWGDIGEVVHAGGAPPLAGDPEPAAVFVTLPLRGAAPGVAPPPATRREAVARGPRVLPVEVPQLDYARTANRHRNAQCTLPKRCR
jgi:signal peptidase